MNAKGIINSLAALALAVAVTTQGIAPVFADDNSGDSQGQDTNYAWNGGLPAPEIFNAKPAVGYAAVGGPAGTAPITFHGGLAPVGGGANVGVTRSTPKVYLVFWGSQWGTDTQISATVGTRTVDTFSGDPKGVAPYLQDLMAGLGTTGDNWSGVVTEFCDQLALGATVCGSQDVRNRAGFPAKTGILAGVWYDNSTNTSEATSATTASQSALAAEAVKAAKYFGNGSQAANITTQYVIVSPTGTHPNGFNYSTTGWCAWHSYKADATVGNVAYTNLPYIPDMGASCGANFVNAGVAGTLDGVSIVEGHELAETQTDQWPGTGGGYYDSSGYENGDKCSWTSPTDSRNGGNITLTTGVFAMQGTWSNLNAWCSMGSALAGTTATFSATSGAAVSGRIATGGALPYTFVANTQLPTGLSLANDGRIITTGAATPGTYSYNYTVTDAAGTVVTAASNITIAPAIATTTSLTVSSSAVTPTTSVTMTATVSPTLASATVGFYDGLALLGTAKTTTAGVATLSKTFAAGSHSLTATLTAPSGYAPSTSSAVLVTSTQATTITIKSSTTSTRVGTSVSLTGTLSVKVANQTVAFVDSNNVTLGTGLTNTSGVATLSYKWTAATPTGYTVKAVFAAVTGYAGSTSTALAITVK